MITTDQLAAFARAATTAPAKEVGPHIFSGKLHEDPTTFLDRARPYLQRQRLLIPEDMDTAIQPYLAGDAATWYKRHAGSITDTEDFELRFKDEFLNPRREKELHHATGTLQKSDEPPDAFVSRMKTLCLRYNPDWPEAKLVTHIVNLMTEEYYEHIASEEPTTFNELRRLCSKWGRILFNNRTRPKNTQPKAVTPTPPTKPAGKNTDTGPPQCRFCPERHLHSECPVRPQWNRDRHPKAGESNRTAPPAPGRS